MKSDVAILLLGSIANLAAWNQANKSDNPIQTPVSYLLTCTYININININISKKSKTGSNRKTRSRAILPNLAALLTYLYMQL